MDETPAALPLSSTDTPLVPLTAPPMMLPRWFAALQVVLVCGIPTQLVILPVLLIVTGIPLFDGDGISLELFASVSLIDTAAVAILIRIFLSLSGEDSRTVFIGRRPIGGEILRGLALLPVVFLLVMGLVLGLRTLAPWMHNVVKSPLEAYMRTPIEAAIFMVVVILAGGVREEIQRAFILHRFEQRLGGVRVGLVVFSVIFGSLHLDQGIDIAVVVGLLGMLWGILYIKRRSAIASMVNHASFDAVQVLQGLFLKTLGG